MVSPDQFHDLLLKELPALKSALPESYPPSNALMCFAGYAQSAIRGGDADTLRKCFAVADRCLREGDSDLKEKLNDYFFVQLTPTDARPKPGGGWLRRLIGGAPPMAAAETATACMTPAEQAAWRAAEAERKGTRTELEFIEQTKMAFPEFDAPPAAVAYLINPHLDAVPALVHS